MSHSSQPVSGESSLKTTGYAAYAPDKPLAPYDFERRELRRERSRGPPPGAQADKF